MPVVLRLAQDDVWAIQADAHAFRLLRFSEPELVGDVCCWAGVEEFDTTSDLTRRVGVSFFEREQHLSSVVVCALAA